MKTTMNATVMNRLEFLRTLEGIAVCSLAGSALMPSNSSAAPMQPLDIGSGPQLFLDDYLIERLEGLKRQVQAPQRLAQPVLDSMTFGTTQPYMTVLRDPQTDRFRIWYNNGPAIWHAESEDGVHWVNPRELWKVPYCFGACVIDDGARVSDPQRRFKLANWQQTRPGRNQPGEDSGTWVAFSPDGLTWTSYDKNPVLSTWPEGFGKIVAHGANDVVDVYHDPLRQCYRVALKTYPGAGEGFAQAPRADRGVRRLVSMSESEDFIHWEKPVRILAPDDKDDGLLEFYGMGGMHLRGGLHIGLARILRDDLACDPGGLKDGIGYAALATSRDGVTWHRYREPFLDRNPEPGSWDHAMTWIGCALPMGDEMFFYYGGYARGHKLGRNTERQIGLARMKKDRYVALTPELEQGTLLTHPFLYPGGGLTINTDASKGEVRVRLLGEDGQPMKDLGDAEATLITTDALAAEVRWPNLLDAFKGRPARLEFKVRNAALFGFEFHPARE